MLQHFCLNEMLSKMVWGQYVWQMGLKDDLAVRVCFKKYHSRNKARSSILLLLGCYVLHCLCR